MFTLIIFDHTNSVFAPQGVYTSEKQLPDKLRKKLLNVCNENEGREFADYLNDPTNGWTQKSICEAVIDANTSLTYVNWGF